MANNALEPAELPAGVEELLASWRTAWLTVDKKLMLSLFDADAADFVYQAEEQADPIHDTVALTNYWNAGADVALAGIPKWDIRSRTTTVSGDIVVIFAVVSAEILVNGLPGVIGGDMHATLIARKSGTDWKFFHYHEGRQVDPSAYVTADGSER